MKTNAWLVGMTCLFAGLWIGTLAEKSAVAQSHNRVSDLDIVNAHTINLLDNNGKPRIMISAALQGGISSIIMSDPNGNIRANLTQTGNQDAALTLWDKSGTPFFSADSKKGPGVLVYDSATKSSVVLSTGTSGGYVETTDTSGQVNSRLPR